MARILRGEIRWADFNPVRGHEHAGQRPVLVLSHDVFNERSGTVIAVALTRQEPRAGYPLTLEELVEGVAVNGPNPEEQTTVKFLQHIPVDPITEEEEWGMRSYQDDWDSTSWGGENIYDVYSLSTQRALDGTYYSEW